MDNDGFLSIERKCEIYGVIMAVLTAFLMLSLMTDGFEAGAESGRPIDGMLSVPNLLGAPGALAAGVLAVLIGDAAHVLYALTMIWALRLLVHRPIGRLFTRIVGLLFLTGALAGTLQIGFTQGLTNPQPGGIVGLFVAEQLLVNNFGVIGSTVMAATVAFIGLLLATDLLFVHMLVSLQRVARRLLQGMWFVLRMLWRGIMWLFSTSETEAPDAAEQAMDMETTATPMPEAMEKEAGFFARCLAAMKPTVRKVEEEDAAFDEWESEPERPAPSKPNIVVAGETTDTAAPASPTGETPFEMPLDACQREMETPAPFGEVPDPDGDAHAVDELISSERSPEADLFAASQAFEDTAETAPTPAPPETPQPSAAKNAQADEAHKVAEILAGKTESAPPTPKLRRKSVSRQDDVPEGYQYPDVYERPSLDLFAPAERKIIPNLREKLGKTATQLEQMLRTFNLEAQVTDVTRGPTITRFELEPAPGMKVSRFLSLTDDIALALKAKGVRVEAPIPGKGRVGIEISNEERDPVVVRELLEDRRFQQAGSTLELALGKDIAGDVRIADLMRMPHLLVAGATGAGKTVCIKSLLASLLYQHTPDQLQLMLIDPKMVELSIFNDIPHLITPVVTDPKKAATSLTWLINEMEERYRLFADLRVRNIEVYNASVENGEIEMEGANKNRALSIVRKLPYIVCVIDELADLMMLARAEVEDAIARLAQLARAVGIHLIIATQRPSVDVLTGVIKANFPARISFQVSSRVDSRCILDEIGAERLIGMGDMLYLPPGHSKPARIQGAFVSDEEMLALIAHLKRQAPPQYRDEIENFGKSKDAMGEMEAEDDPLFEDAVRVVLETGQASISMVQRRLRVGYTRAARLIDMMELKGIVGPHTGSKAREILVATTAKE